MVWPNVYQASFPKQIAQRDQKKLRGKVVAKGEEGGGLNENIQYSHYLQIYRLQEWLEAMRASW